jgi:multidrug resistance efflux pump
LIGFQALLRLITMLSITMAPEVAGRIVELHVVDNKYVRKGDLLMVIDPTNYRIALSQAEAAVQQAQASVQSIDAQTTVQQAQISATLVFARVFTDKRDAQRTFGELT